ncbi:hypothetical protein A5722_01235 [Mycobacterium vulneris]|nr:hypothetical protein A5637_11600 [Mycolicibacterium fortuitum]OBK62743.1 hypothetical protein A5654_25520 [Mycolicibacterium fortuitum]OCB48698.1 hypothetical protein A5721_04530 [Mycolicibacterium vulneris]OCB51504.1 hypothetical protein A5722_01235 [Mycolicibacterium vulneris]OCB67415.1 hypothetical protein A5729_07615 [Mycolicibacterium vulneris]
MWQASAHQIRTSRICSASSTGKAAVTSPEIREIVDNIYDEHLTLPTQWTPQQRDQFLEAEASRISRQVAEVAAQMGEQAVRQWQTEHGQHPDYLTKVGLLNTTRAQAMEIVLSQELYEKIPQNDESSELPASQTMLQDRLQVPWQQRWTHSALRIEPSEQIEGLVAEVWPAPDFSAVFRIKAGYLLAARAEEYLPLPSHPDDPLAATLAPLILADLRHDGLPER